jgi:ribosome-associated protein YbcJ (S4-like RNA binding protein)
VGRFDRIEREVRINGPSITLGQLLKLSGVIESGAAAKQFLREEQVSVNGEPEARRGRKLALGDAVRVGELELRITSDP